jgi:hypothetical protein
VQCLIKSGCALLDFETDDGRTFADADASIVEFVVFIAFFLKPLSVTLPFAARFTVWGDTEPRAGAHSRPSES